MVIQMIYLSEFTISIQRGFIGIGNRRLHCQNKREMYVYLYLYIYTYIDRFMDIDIDMHFLLYHSESTCSDQT